MEDFPPQEKPLEPISRLDRCKPIFTIAKALVHDSLRPTRRRTSEEYRQYLEDIYGRGGVADEVPENTTC